MKKIKMKKIKKRNILTFFTLILTLIFSNAVFSQQIKTDNKKLEVINGRYFVVTPDVVAGEGEWELANYDKTAIDLREHRTIPKTSFRFAPIKEGDTRVVTHYKENGRITHILNFDILIKPLSEQETDDDAIIDDMSLAEDIEETEIGNEEIETAIEETEEAVSIDEEKSKMIAFQKELIFIRNLYNRGLYEDVESELVKLKNNYSSNEFLEEITFLEGETKIKLQKYNEAEDIFAQYINNIEDSTRDKGEAYLKLAQTYRIQKENSKARYIYIRILSFFNIPEIIANAHLELAKLYNDMGNYESAVVELEAIVNEFNDSDETILEEALFMLGNLYMRNTAIENYDKAHKNFSLYIELFPIGRYSTEAKNKLEYLDENFINYR